MTNILKLTNHNKFLNDACKQKTFAQIQREISVTDSTKLGAEIKSKTPLRQCVSVELASFLKRSVNVDCVTIYYIGVPQQFLVSTSVPAVAMNQYAHHLESSHYVYQ